MRPVLGICLALSLAAVLFAACSSSDEALGGDYSGSQNVGAGTTGGGGDAGIDVVLQGGGGPEPLSYRELCGTDCIPGTAVSVACNGSGGSGGGGGATGTECQLAYDDNLGHANGVCGTEGMSQPGDPCFTAAQCPAGYGCAGANGSCRPYCCDDLEACPDQTYCAPTEMAPDEYTGDPMPKPVIPVCIPVQDCTLLDDATCPVGETCTIVRVDGTTSCVPVGMGELNQPCPCAAGYVCSTGRDTCLKLCRVDMASTDCPSEAPKCQSGANIYPPGFGVCVEQ